jgi:DNA-nicking Smr family endonuclease
MRRPGDAENGANPAERALFEDAVSDVEPLDRDRLIPHLSFRQPVTLSERESEVLRELDALCAGDAPFEPEQSADRIEGKVPGLDPRMLTRLRRGEFTVQADLDLHGVDAPSARALVETFLIECQTRGLRCVRIVHGRGRNSPDGIPVLKRNLPRWLARGPARLAVLAYATAAPKDGGAGASYVLLRRRRPASG